MQPQKIFKKLKLYIIVLLVGLSILFLDYVDEAALRDFDRNALASIPALTLIDVDYIETEENAPYNAETQVYYYFSKIPEEIRNSFVEHGYKIRITKDMIPFKDTEVFGLYSRKEKLITVWSGLPEGIIHEMGHFVDFEYLRQESGKITETPQWQSICSAETELIASIDKEAEMNTYNAVECFAESFRLYLTDPDFASIAPQTYNFFKTHLSFS